MPTLGVEVNLYPDNLLQHPPNLGQWTVVYTKSRAEKVLARWLARKVGFYLPVAPGEGKTGISFVPLFPGYVFVHGTEEGLLYARKSNKVAHCISVPDQERLTADLRAVQRLIAAERDIFRLQGMGRAFASMDEVEIPTGPLERVRGKRMKIGARDLLVVEIAAIGEKVAVEVSAADLMQSSNQADGTNGDPLTISPAAYVNLV
jgi:transcription antitermination factor NusG